MSGAAFSLALAGIAVFVIAALVGPFFSHPDYSWFSHTTSELAGQTMPNAWIMRLGFISFGAGVSAAAVLRRRVAPFTCYPLIVFGLAMMAAALWSNAPIDPETPFSQREDALHSIAASTMGFAFAAATAGRLWRCGWSMRDGLSWLGLGSSVGLPLLMAALPQVDGALQRIMFTISFVWIAREMRARPDQAASAT